MKRILTILLGICLLASLAAGCAKGGEPATLPDPAGAKIAVLVGTTSEAYAEANYPKADRLPFESLSDAVAALLAGKADYVVSAYTNCLNYARANAGKLTVLPEKLTSEGSSIAINKDEKALSADITRVVTAFLADGTMEKLISNWIREDGSAYVRDEIPRLGSDAPVLHVAVSAEREPMCFVADGSIVGLDAELIERIAYELGMRVEFSDMKFAAMIPSVLSGKTPVAISNISATDERRQSVDFSPEYFSNPQVLMTRTELVPKGGAVTAETEGFTTLSSLAGKRIGITSGSIFDQSALKQWPDAELFYYDSNADMIIALQQDKLDCFLADQPVARQVRATTPGVTYLSETLEPDQYGFVFQKNDAGAKLRDEFNDFIATAEDGKLLESLDAIWYGSDEAAKTVEPAEGLPATNGIVRFAATMEDAPFGYVKNEQPVGFEVDLITRFCKAGGYGLEINSCTFSALLPGIVSNRYDAVSSCISITEERAQSVHFSEPVYVGGVVAVVLDAGAGEAGAAVPPETARIGAQTGTSFEGLALERFPDAAYSSFSTLDGCMLALKSGQIDYAVMADLDTKHYQTVDANYRVVDPPLKQITVCAAISKDRPELQEQIDTLLSQYEKEGLLDRLYANWFEAENLQYVREETPVRTEGEVLRVIITSASEPSSFIWNGELCGYDIELVRHLAYDMGMQVEFIDVDGAAMVPALASGKGDIILCGLTYTEERAEKVLFSRPYITLSTVLACYDKGGAAPSDMTPPETARIGSMTGTTCEALALERYPNASYSSFTSVSDLMTALKSGKLDYCVMDQTDAINYKRSDAGYTVVPGELKRSGYNIAVKKGNEALVDALNAKLDQYEADGTLARLKEHWIRPDGSAYVVDEVPAIAEGPELRVAFCSGLEPCCFIKDGEYTGHDIELIRRLAYDLGYSLTFMDMDFSALVAALESGRADVAISGMAATEERAQKVDFTRRYYESPLVLVRYESAAAEKEGFFSALSNSFYKNFILESRYKLIFSGIGVTLLLSICSGVVGILIGFGFCLLRMSRIKALVGVTSAFTRVLQGTPMVVLLMILYYVVFNKTGLDGVAVAIITFGLNFGAYASEIMLSGINAVDNGQREAAAAIGFSPAETFAKIVFPQAARHFLPVLKGEYISLVKMTSIVGYVAVQDLTKMSDIIRSRTYEAFFPLIVSAVIYFLLSYGLSSLLTLVEVRIDPKHRPRTLKGVELK